MSKSVIFFVSLQLSSWFYVRPVFLGSSLILFDKQDIPVLSISLLSRYFLFLELSVLSLTVWFSIFYGLVCGGYFPFVLFSFALNIYFLCCTQLLWMTILLSVRLPVVMCLRWYPSHHLTASSMLYFRWSLDIQPSPISDRLSLASYMGLNPWSIQYCCLGMKQQLKGFLHCILCLD